MLGCEARPPGFKARQPCSLLAVGPLAGDLLSRACFLIREHLPSSGRLSRHGGKAGKPDIGLWPSVAPQP